VVINRSFFTNQSGDFLTLRNNDGTPIALQHDDLDNDGAWDEVAFEYSLKAKEEATLSYEWVTTEELPSFEKRTGVLLGHSETRNNQFVPTTTHTRPKDHVAQSTPFLYQAEGPIWESDLVAFRTYFDSRNGKDIFAKTKVGLFADEMGTSGNYHELQEWGMDVLKVGGSLGAGAIAILKADSLYRLSQTEEAKFEVLVSGPVRTIFKLTYTGWKVGETKYDLSETIAIWAGKRHYESELVLSGGNGSDTLVTGIVNLKELEAAQVITKDQSILYTHGLQSENHDVLGMAVIVPGVHFLSFGEAALEGNGVTNTYTALLKSNYGVYQYAFLAGWELENYALKDENAFIEELKNTTTAQNELISIIKE
jgi:hypothetical protein